MGTTPLEDIELSKGIEKQLSTQLAKGDVSIARIAESLEAIRSSSEAAILKDFNVAAIHHAEDRLWKAHQDVNMYFRTALAQARKQATHPVASRKIRTDYVKFVKSSQRFYRTFVRHLSEAYGGIPILERVAQKLNRDVAGDSVIPRSAVFVSETVITRSCHRTLIQLGDLSRYRETEVGGEKRDWSPAIGYYDLAGSILPISGQSHNQLAVIALSEGNHFRAIYHIFRSLATEEPHPLSKGNLKVALLKISSSREKGKPVQKVIDSNKSSTPDALLDCYMKLLELYYQGNNTGQITLEDEVLSNFSSLIKQSTPGSTLHRIVIVNIASAYVSQKRFQAAADSSNHVESYLALLRLNLRTFVALLEQLRNELDDLLMRGAAGQTDEANAVIRKLSVRTVGNLPQLRIYTAWLRKNIVVLTSMGDNISTTLLEKFWSAYAKSLSLMAEAFPTDSLPDLSYMLEEDVDTLGFEPVQCDANRGIWYEGDKLKAPWHEPSNEQAPAAEMLFRIRGILVAGLELSFDSQTPLEFDQDQYCFRVRTKPKQDARRLSVEVLENDMMPPAPMSNLNEGNPGDHIASTVRKSSLVSNNSQDLEVDIQRMVDGLLDVGLGPNQPQDFAAEHRSIADHLHKSGRSLSDQREQSVSPRDHVLGYTSIQTSRRQSQALQQQHDESWAAFRRPSGPVTPKQPSQMARFGTSLRSSPLPPPPGLSGHHRHMSTDSTRSRNSIWTPEEAWSSGLGVNTSLGNGSFGANQPLEQPSDYGMGSSLLFGAGASPWNLSVQESSNMLDSPRTAAIWDSPTAPTYISGRRLS